jgi:hypothetical protein
MSVDEIIEAWRSLNAGLKAHQHRIEGCNQFVPAGMQRPTRLLMPGTIAFVRAGTVLPTGQMTLDGWYSDSTSETSSNESTGDHHVRMRRPKSKVDKGTKAKGNFKKRKTKCRAERIREWELRGGKRKPKLFHGNSGWQLHIMPAGSEEERVKAAQRDWSKPIPATLIGVFSKDSAAHNTFLNSYAFDGNDEPDAPIRDFERVLAWKCKFV